MCGNRYQQKTITKQKEIKNKSGQATHRGSPHSARLLAIAVRREGRQLWGTCIVVGTCREQVPALGNLFLRTSRFPQSTCGKGSSDRERMEELHRVSETSPPQPWPYYLELPTAHNSHRFFFFFLCIAIQI